jgi:tetratricopeptide (TPR) repeat protein
MAERSAAAKQQKVPRLRTFEAFLREPDTWRDIETDVRLACNVRERVLEFIWAYAEPSKEQVAAATRLKVKWRSELAAARETVATLLNLDPREWRSHIAEHAAARTIAVIDLVLESAEAIKHLPVRMHELTTLATEVTRQLDEAGQHRISLQRARGRAWRYHAVALEGLTRYRDALDACDAADCELGEAPTLADEAATVAYVRGMVLARMGELDRALAQIHHASRMYEVYGDKQRYVKARVVEGYVLYKAQRNKETLELWTSLIGDARAISDFETLASLHLNVGDELRNQRDFERATWHIRTSLGMFTKLKMTSEIPRARLSLARVKVLRADYEGALPDLWKVCGEFTNLRMHMAAANVRLEIVEILLILGRAEEAHELCLDLPAIYLEAGITENALQAGAHLRECAELRVLHEADIQHVRLFLQDLPQNPTKAFVPLRRAGR